MYESEQARAERIRRRIGELRLERQINPPLIIRERCRFCAHPIVLGEPTLAMKKCGEWPEVFVHEACYTREVTP